MSIIVAITKPRMEQDMHQLLKYGTEEWSDYCTANQMFQVEG